MGEAVRGLIMYSNSMCGNPTTISGKKSLVGVLVFLVANSIVSGDATDLLNAQ